jgi:hypothetical protein
MGLKLCHQVEFKYRGEGKEELNTWRKACRRASEKPRVNEAGRYKVESSTDHVVVSIAVPCSDDGVIDREAFDLSEARADNQFDKFYPSAVLVVKRVLGSSILHRHLAAVPLRHDDASSPTTVMR